MGLESGVLHIDNREKDDELLYEVERVAEERDVEHTYTHLDSGDYVYSGEYGRVAIEQKEINDAVHSATNDRLHRQCDQMAEEYDRAWLWVVGKTSEIGTQHGDMGYGQSYGQLKGAMPEILATMNIPVQWVRNENIFADVAIRALLSAGDKGLEDNQLLLVSPGVADDTQMAMLQSIDGIGHSASKLILEKYGSLRAVKDAEYYELLEISGVGSTTARKIYNTFNDDWDGPGYDAAHADNPMYSFFQTSGVSEDVFYRIWDATDGLRDDPYEYFEENFDMGPHRHELTLDAIEETVEKLGYSHNPPEQLVQSG